VCGLLLTAFLAEVRLAGNSPNSSAGRLEVKYVGTADWGTVCDHYWDLSDADVACRMLGFKSAISAASGAYFGEGTGTIWMGDLLCFGNESSLLLCSHSGPSVHNCDHSQDVGLACSS